METILDDGTRALQRLLEDAKIRKRDDRIGRNDPACGSGPFEGSSMMSG